MRGWLQLDRVAWVCVALAAGVVSLAISAVTPPFQSPDEFYHVKAAYLLTQFDRPGLQRAGFSTGGDIDQGLVAYAKLHNETQKMPSGPVRPEARDMARTIRWSGSKVFDECPIGYLPAVYVPQAVALWIGQRLDLTVDSSYRLSRMAVTLVFAALCAVAFWLHTPPPLSVAVTVLPMTLFQASAASIDGVATGAAVLALSALFRICSRGIRGNWVLVAVFVGALCVLIPCRPYLLPLLVLPVVVLPSGRSKWIVVSIAGLPILISVAWSLAAVTEMVDLRPSARPPLSQVLGYYVANPGRIVQVIVTTLSDSREMQTISRSFVGILGWMDTRLRSQDYALFAVLLAVAAAITIDVRGISRHKTASIAVAFCALASAALVFMSIWLLWSPHPAVVVYGIQGRYFSAPVILLGYAIGPVQGLRSAASRWAGVAVVVLILAVSATVTIDQLGSKHVRYLTAAGQSLPVGASDEANILEVAESSIR